MNCMTPGFPGHHQYLELAQTHVHWVVIPSNYLILCRLLLLPSVFPPSGSFPVSQFFTSGGQSIGASASLSVLPVNIQDWFLLGLNLFAVQRTRRESSPTPQFKSINSSVLSFLYGQLSHLYMTTGKTIALTRWTFVGKVMSLFFNMLSRLVMTFFQGASVF